MVFLCEMDMSILLSPQWITIHNIFPVYFKNGRSYLRTCKRDNGGHI